MILLEIKQYLMTKKRVILQQIAVDFKKDPEMMRMMLRHWINKGCVAAAAKPAGCGSRCTQCKPEFAEVYCWVEAGYNP